MAISTFAPSIAPSPGTRHNPKIDILQADFGDGFTQVAPNGLKHIREVVFLRWEALTEPQLQELKTFFTERGGFRPFYYQPRGFLQVLKWTCPEWSMTDGSPWTFEAKLEQYFGLEN